MIRLQTFGPPEASQGPEATTTASEQRQSEKGHRNWFAITLVVIIIIIAMGLAVAFESRSRPSQSTTSLTMISTSYNVSPNSVLSSAVQQNKSGYVLESSGRDWRVLDSSDGSFANMTVRVFSSTNASQAHYGAFVASVKGLPGYTDASSELNSFQQYGRCYAYEEGVENFTVVNGICSKGNVILKIHLASTVSLQQLEADMVTLMRSLYDSVD